MGKKVAVVAGTGVDTRMGVDFLAGRDPSLDLICHPVAPTPQDCHLIQLRSQREKDEIFQQHFARAEEQGARDFFLYCNSLSACFDFETMAESRGDRVYTPLQIYRELGQRYRRLAVIAANNQSTAGIEKCLYERNGSISVIGVGYLAMVEAVEAALPPEELIRRFRLAELCRYFEENGAEALILGCTHFPYFQEALAAQTSLPLINPAEEMYQRMMAQ